MLEDLFKNEGLHVLCEAATLKHLSYHMSALIIFREMEDVIFK